MFEYITMVHGVDIEFNEESIATILGWTDTELRDESLERTLDWMAPNKYKRICEQQGLERFIYKEMSVDFLAPGGKHRKNCLDAKELHSLARTLSMIVTYNIFPHWNYIEPTVDTLIMIYCIRHKVKVHWHIFICYYMMKFKSIIPFASLVTQMIQEYFA